MERAIVSRETSEHVAATRRAQQKLGLPRRIPTASKRRPRPPRRSLGDSPPRCGRASQGMDDCPRPHDIGAMCRSLAGIVESETARIPGERTPPAASVDAYFQVRSRTGLPKREFSTAGRLRSGVRFASLRRERSSAWPPLRTMFHVKRRLAAPTLAADNPFDGTPCSFEGCRSLCVTAGVGSTETGTE